MTQHPKLAKSNLDVTSILRLSLTNKRRLDADSYLSLPRSPILVPPEGEVKQEHELLPTATPMAHEQAGRTNG